MKRSFVVIVLHIVTFLRTFISPWLYKKHYKVKGDEAAWARAKMLSMTDFSKEINNDAKYGYKWDTFKGLLDSSFSSTNPAYFFAPLTKGRDCDDYARIWRLWGEANGYTGYEYIVTDPAKPFQRAHMITLLHQHTQWWLMNYKPYGPYASKEAALQAMTHWYPSDFVAVQYHFEKET